MTSQPTPEILSTGDRIENGEYLLHSRFRRAANFAGEGGLATLADPSIGEGPYNIILNPFPAEFGRLMRIFEGTIEVAGMQILRPTGSVYDSRPSLSAPDRDGLPARLEQLHRALADLSPDRSLAFLLDREREKAFKTVLERNFVEKIKRGTDLLLEGRTEKGAKLLRGTGFGLTPSGDDFLAGTMVGLNLRALLGGEDTREIRNRIWNAARGANPLVNLFLAMGRDFNLPRRLKELVEALGTGKPARVYEQTRRWLRSGATSQADLAVGIYLTMKKGGRICS